ncbi:MAG: VWA domain-containing protein [Akkermansiaceae bacterium]|jgi:hypothetical protein|nr:VWA domain-containing protein [Akkermansiaceae bacterium]
MSFFLQHPTLLGLLALAVLPPLVHLLSRAKPPVYEFSNIEFLRKVLRLTTRLRRPKDWLLLALRTLAIAALAAAFLGPLLLSDSAPLPGAKRSIVCVIDRSGSMSANEGAASRFDAACAEASRTLDSAKPELANVVWIDASPDAAFPEPGPNRDFLTDELSRARAHAEPDAIDAAFELAARQLAKAEGRKEIHVFSDFQASSWKDAAPHIASDVHLQMVPVATAAPDNVAVTSLIPLPASPVAGRPLLVQVRVTNHSPEPRRISLTLDAGGSRQSQSLDLPASGTAEAGFQVRCDASGLLPLSATIDSDSFSADDSRHAVVRVRESIRMGVVGDPASPAVLAFDRIAAALTWLDLIPVENLASPPPCDLLVVTAWQGESPESLRKLAAGSTAVIVFPSAASSSAIGELLAETGLNGDTPLAIESSEDGWEATPSAEHPAFALFRGGEFGNPVGGRFLQRMKLPTLATSKVLARYADAVPAMVASPDSPLMLVNLPIDPAQSTWPLQSSFLPALAEIILHLCPSGPNESFTAEPGEPLRWTAPADDLGTAPLLEGPDGQSLAIESSSTADGTTWSTSTAPGSGLYRWTVSGQPVHFTAVNFPESESALAPLPEPPAIAHGGSSASSQRRATPDDGLNLWPWLIALALGFLILEALLATPRRSPLSA